jgi:chromosome segregation ATPase
VEVPVDRIVETRDEREIWRMRDENDEMARRLRDARNENNELENEITDMQSRFERERERMRREYEDEINYSRDRIRNMDGYSFK